MAGTETEKDELKVIERIINSGAGKERLSFVPGVAGSCVQSNPLWRRFDRVRLDGKICQVVRCKECETVLAHRTGTPYDRSVGRSSGTTCLKRHNCPRKASQTPITGFLKKSIPEGACRSEKKTVAAALSDVCAEDIRPFNVVEGKCWSKNSL